MITSPLLSYKYPFHLFHSFALLLSISVIRSTVHYRYYYPSSGRLQLSSPLLTSNPCSTSKSLLCRVQGIFYRLLGVSTGILRPSCNHLSLQGTAMTVALHDLLFGDPFNAVCRLNCVSPGTIMSGEWRPRCMDPWSWFAVPVLRDRLDLTEIIIL